MSRLLRMPAPERFSAPEYQRKIVEAIARQTSDAIFVTDTEGAVTQWNPAAEQIFGFCGAEIEGCYLHDLIHHHYPDGRPWSREQCPMEIVRREGMILRDQDTVLFHRSGETIVASVSASPIEIDGIPAGSLLTIRDMTASRKAERALREGDERIRRLVNADVAGIVIAAGDRLIQANDYFLNLLGYSRLEFERTGLTLPDRTPPEFAGVLDERRQMLLANGSCPAFEMEFLRKDGTRVPVLMGGVTCDYEGEPCMVGFVIDISERRARERQIQQSHRLETIGQLAGGIAHDFNNLLTIIIGHSEQLIAQLPAAHPLTGVAREIAESASHAAELTRELVLFGRERPAKRESLRLDELVPHVHGLLRRLIGNHIRISVNLAQEPLAILADAAQMEQVLLNLAVNARDSMPDGGTLWIETSMVSAEDELAAMCLGAPPGRYVQLMMSDTGTGMTAEVREQCFQPFFTTKEPGKGSGLGLSTVRAIVTQTGGFITVHSAPGCGTSFRILFPVAETIARTADIESSAPGQGSGTLLVVDDEERIRSYIVSVLKDSGYEVLEAANGADALKVARTHKGAIDLLLTDFAMPGLNGREMARRLDRKREGLKVLVISGYGEIEAVSQRRDMAYLQKPFTRKELLAKVRETMSAPRTFEEQQL